MTERTKPEAEVPVIQAEVMDPQDAANDKENGNGSLLQDCASLLDGVSRIVGKFDPKNSAKISATATATRVLDKNVDHVTAAGKKIIDRCAPTARKAFGKVVDKEERSIVALREQMNRPRVPGNK